MNFSLLALIHYFNTLPPETFWVVQLVCGYSGVLVMMRFFGKTGIYVFIAVAIIAANIQVLKVVQFSVFVSPVTLGTVLISSTYLSVDILTEYYGVKAARKGVFIGFAAVAMMMLWMILGMSFKPAPQAHAIQGDLENIFIPSMTILVSSMLSYVISELTDVWLFSKIKKMTGVRFLWLRNNVSTLLGALLDNIVFNTLAFVLFGALGYRISLHDLIFTYILGLYVLRMVISILDTPFIYWARHCVAVTPEEERL